MFPSLVNCCAIDWFEEWLSSFCTFKEILSLLIVGDYDMKEKISEMCVYIHDLLGN
jgi:dynein heavy chain